VVLTAGTLACGPTILSVEDDGAMDGTAEGTTSAASTTSTTTITTITTVPTTAGDDLDTTGPDDGEETASIRLDILVPPDPDPGRPPDTCTPPVGLGTDLNGVTPLGEVHMQAAVFAETGGGKCPWAYRVVFAPDLAQLADVIASYEMPGPVDAMVQIELEFPPEGPVPGQWSGAARHGTNLGIWLGDATADVTFVTRLDDPMPTIEGTVWITDRMDSGMIEGTFSASYCNIVHGFGCGAVR
jgi:hypothetical protein